MQELILYATREMQRLNLQKFPDQKNLLEDFDLVEKMLQFSQANMDDAERANLRYDVIELQKLRDDLPKIKRFEQDMTYLRDIDINTVYENYH